MFAFALDRDLITASPAVRIPRPGQEQRRDRVLSDTELRARWLAWDDLPAPMAAFYRLRLLTAQRGGEVASMRWQDVDLESGWWTIPAGASKNKLAHRVPLNVSAVNILATLLQSAHKDAVYVIGAVFSLYLNVFVLVAQAFLKIPALKALAPTQAEPPFALAQGVVLVVFVALGIVAAMRYRPGPA